MEREYFPYLSMAPAMHPDELDFNFSVSSVREMDVYIRWRVKISLSLVDHFASPRYFVPNAISQEIRNIWVELQTTT